MAAAIIGSAVLGAGASLVAGDKSASAATAAAATQADAAKYAAQIQAMIYGITRGDLSPFVQLGQGAIKNLNALLPGGITSAAPNAGAQTLQGNLLGGTSLGSGGIAGPGGVPAAGAQPGTAGAAPPDASTFSPGSLSPDQLTAANGYATDYVRNQLGQKYAGQDNLPEGSVGGAYKDPNDPSAGIKYDPNNINVDITKPGWSLQDLQASYPGIDLSKIMGGAGVPGTPATPQAPDAAAGSSDFLKSLMSMLPGGTDSAVTAVNALTDPNNPDIARIKSFLPNPDGTSSNPVTQGMLNLAPGTPGFYANPLVKSLAGFIPGGGSENPLLTTLQGLLGVSGDPAATQKMLESTPGYQFVKNQGLIATQNGFAAKGLGSSGAAMKGAAQFVTGLADSTYENRLTDYLNSYNSQFTNTLNTYDNLFTNSLNANNTGFTNALNTFSVPASTSISALTQKFSNAFNAYGQQSDLVRSLLGLGVNAGAQTGDAGSKAGGQIGASTAGAGAATAAGIVGSANASTNALLGAAGSAGNALMQYGAIRNPAQWASLTGQPGVTGTGNALVTNPGAIPQSSITGMYR